MRPITRQALLIAMLVLALWAFENLRPIPQPPGILVNEAPHLTPLTSAAPTFRRNEHVYTALAQLDAKGRILSIERYGRDRESRAALLDIALGWGRMSDTVTLKGVDVAQSERRVLSKSYLPDYPDSAVEANLLNLHLVPASTDIENQLKTLRAGNVVRLHGYLVEATSSDGWRWKGQLRQSSPALPGTLMWVNRMELETPATKS